MSEQNVEEIWRNLLIHGQVPQERRRRQLFKHLPHKPRCKLCYAPFSGIGATLVRMIYDRRPSKYNPRFCTVCEHFAREYVGGAEVELAMLFADVRGSTTLAEKMRPSDFSRLIDRFYRVAIDSLTRSDALLEKLQGDAVTGLFFPGFAGPDYARRAIETAIDLRRATGHEHPAGPWLPIGIGVHCGVAFAGSVGSKEGITEITALGDAVNTAARIASQAKAGEILISEEASRAAGWNVINLEQRHLTLKGRSEAIDVRVIRASTSQRN